MSINQKLSAFLETLEHFQGNMTSYKSDISRFNQTINQLILNSETPLNEATVFIKGSGSRQYLLTHDGLVLSYNTDHEEKDFSYNSIVTISQNNVKSLDKSISAFYVKGAVAKGVKNSNGNNNINIVYPNQIVQYDLETLQYNTSQYNTDHESKQRIIKQSGAKPSSVLLNSGSNSCTLDDFYKCDGYAKTKNNDYYALNHTNKDNTSGCYCYIFENIDDFNEKTSEYQKEVTSKETSLDGFAYFGILFDGNLYGLKDKLYSNNYKGFYETDNSKVEKILSTTFLNNGSNETKCHPFVGDGPYKASFNNLDHNDQCRKKN